MQVEGEDRGLDEERVAIDEDVRGAEAGPRRAEGVAPVAAQQGAGTGDTSGAGPADDEAATSSGAAARAPRGAPDAPAVRRPRFRDRSRDWWLLALAGKGASASRPRPRASGADEEPHAAAADDDSSATEPSHRPNDSAVLTTKRGAPRQQARPAGTARQVRGLIAIIIALFLLGIAVSRFLGPSGSATPAPAATATPAPIPALPAGPFAPVSGHPVTPLAVLGATAGLTQPREALALPNGHYVVADTGNRRLVILDARGHELRVVRRGAAPFQQPFAVATLGSHIAVLDAARGSLDLLSADGTFIRELMLSPQLVDARGLAVGPHDRLYVANPRSNSVLVLSQNGTVVQTFTGPLSAAPGGFNQPSDVAIGGDGTIYVLDNVNDRIEALTPTRAFVQQWPAPRSDTIFSDHLLLLADGRLVATDPAGALVVYQRGNRTPVRLPLQEGNQSRTRIEPVGLALGPHGTLLVTDTQGGTVLLVPLSDLSH